MHAPHQLRRAAPRRMMTLAQLGQTSAGRSFNFFTIICSDPFLWHTTLELTKVNTYGLIFKWLGSNKALQPLLLTAHQGTLTFYLHGWYLISSTVPDVPPDVVPVEPIRSCAVTEGRSAIETMLEAGYQPTRTVVLAFGFDEEIGGDQAVGHQYQRSSYSSSWSFTAGYGKSYGRMVASPGISEKGYADIQINVTVPGGHSSMPPPHTVKHFRLKHE
ncbi:hypothetical protein ID866_8459, partial [Astraeus odoratus]